MILDDFVMLGTTVPEPNSDGRVFVCSAGYSAELRRLVRIYPLARHSIPNRWGVYRVPVELNPKDSRPESYRIASDRSCSAHSSINAAFTRVGEVRPNARPDLLSKAFVGSIREANERRLSLAVVHPHHLDLTFDFNPESPDSPALTLFDPGPRPEVGAKRFPYIPRLRFADDAGEHRLMLRDWGVYERMRKAEGFADWTPTERRDHISGALHLDPSCSLLIGNLNQHRTSWLVIAVLRGLRAQPNLFDSLEAEASA